MEPARKRGAPVAAGRDPKTDAFNDKHNSKSPAEAQTDMRDALLAEFRCAVLQSQLATNDISQIGVALSKGLISVPQAVAHLDGQTAFDWIAGRVSL